MHLLFSQEELAWIDTKVFGWKIREGCPKDISDKIRKKLEILNNQKTKIEGVESNG